MHPPYGAIRYSSYTPDMASVRPWGPLTEVGALDHLPVALAPKRAAGERWHLKVHEAGAVLLVVHHQQHQAPDVHRLAQRRESPRAEGGGLGGGC